MYYYLRQTIVVFLLLFAHSMCIANQSSIIKIVRRPVHLIAIDPGFGGPETGPSGCGGKSSSKDINLLVSKKIADGIKNELGLDTILTRESDKYISLEERTAIANNKKADLFISIHVNGFHDSKVYGIETYCLNLVVDEKNNTTAVSKKNGDLKISKDMDAIQRELMYYANGPASEFLAKKVQSSLITFLDAKYDRINNRGVKHAPFYVFFNTSMPSIVVYPSFITNSQECERLVTEDYQETIAAGIVAGIKEYIEEARKGTMGTD